MEQGFLYYKEKMKSFLVIGMLLLGSCNETNEIVQTNPPAFEAKEFQASDSSVLNYNIYDPSTGDEKLPLFIFLHGAGERRPF